MDERANPLSGRLIVGVALMVLGALWTLDNLGIIADADRIIRWWPVLPLAFGIMKLTGFGTDKQAPFGVFLIVAGGLFLLGELDVADVNFSIIWPLFFIFLGVHLTMRALRGAPPPGPAGEVDSGEYVRSFAVMGAITRRNDSPSFRGGELSAVMGGVDLDLDRARPADGRAVIDVFAVWGGIEIRVPDDWRVEIEATPVMAGIESNARLAPGVEPVGTLVIRGFVMMGGVEIKNTRPGDHPRGARTSVVVQTGTSRRPEGSGTAGDPQ